MRLSCHLIEDLLPLYHDKVCSEETTALVKEHLEECENCRNMLSKIDSETGRTGGLIDDAKPLKAIGSAWKNGKKKAFLTGTVITLALCAVLIGIYAVMTQWKCIPVDSKLLEVTEVSQLSDDEIIYHLRVKDDKNLRFIKFTANADGSYYITPMRSLIEGKRITNNGLFNEYFIVNIKQINGDLQSQGEKIEVTSCYIGTQEDGILLWEEGIKLPKASDSLREMAKSGIYK